MSTRNEEPKLTKFAWLSVAAGLTTIVLKGTAYLLTDSIGLLSDALESGVNLVAAIVALIALTIAALPPDEEHAYGHYKAEYFSSGVEGALILVAAVTIIVTAVNRFRFPQPLMQLDTGLFVLAAAAVVNWLVARVLLRAGQTHRSIVLQASGQHLMTDVWTSGGVIIGIGIITLTGWQLLDPLIAILIGVHIMISGWRLVRDAVLGLMDTALPEAEIEQIITLLQQHLPAGVSYHALRTRQSGRQRFVSVHIQVPGAWTVQEGHTLLEKIEQAIRQQLAPITILTHLEPIEDPVSWDDIQLNRDGV